VGCCEVITELVLQSHLGPAFLVQRARQARPGSHWRDFYRSQTMRHEKRYQDAQ